MNVTLPEKEKVEKRRISIYIISVIVCILAIIIVIGVQILGDDIINNLFGINKLIKRTEQEEAELKSNFETILDNKIDNKENDEIIYTSYKKEEKNNNYEINVNLPYINIKNKEVEKFNEEVKNTFETKAEDVIKSEGENIVYTVKYKAHIENNILSVIIYSDLKQETTAQRIIFRTFNYNIEEKKQIGLEDVIKIYDLKESSVQNKIDTDIKEEQRKADDLKQLGYNVFSRDLESEIYKIKNIEEFFIYNNNIYIIFAYGNNNITSEMDLVII